MRFPRSLRYLAPSRRSGVSRPGSRKKNAAPQKDTQRRRQRCMRLCWGPPPCSRGARVARRNGPPVSAACASPPHCSAVEERGGRRVRGRLTAVGASPHRRRGTSALIGPNGAATTRPLNASAALPPSEVESPATGRRSPRARAPHGGMGNAVPSRTSRFSAPSGAGQRSPARSPGPFVRRGRSWARLGPGRRRSRERRRRLSAGPRQCRRGRSAALPFCTQSACRCRAPHQRAEAPLLELGGWLNPSRWRGLAGLLLDNPRALLALICSSSTTEPGHAVSDKGSRSTSIGRSRRHASRGAGQPRGDPCLFGEEGGAHWPLCLSAGDHRRLRAKTAVCTDRPRGRGAGSRPSRRHSRARPTLRASAAWAARRLFRLRGCNVIKRPSPRRRCASAASPTSHVRPRLPSGTRPSRRTGSRHARPIAPGVGGWLSIAFRLFPRLRDAPATGRMLSGGEHRFWHHRALSPPPAPSASGQPSCCLAPIVVESSPSLRRIRE